MEPVLQVVRQALVETDGQHRYVSLLQNDDPTLAMSMNSKQNKKDERGKKNVMRHD